MRGVRLTFNDLATQTLKKMEEKFGHESSMSQDKIFEAFEKEYGEVLVEYKLSVVKDYSNHDFKENFNRISSINKLVLTLLYSNLYLNRISNLPKTYNKIISSILKKKESVSSFRGNISYWEKCTFDLLITSISQSYKMHKFYGLGNVYPSVGLEAIFRNNYEPLPFELLNAVIENEKEQIAEFRTESKILSNESSSLKLLLSDYPSSLEALNSRISRSRKTISQRGSFYIGAKEDKIFESSLFTRYVGDFGVGNHIYLRSILSKKFEKPSKIRKIKAKILDVHRNRNHRNREIKFEKIFSLGEKILASLDSSN